MQLESLGDVRIHQIPLSMEVDQCEHVRRSLFDFRIGQFFDVDYPHDIIVRYRSMAIPSRMKISDDPRPIFPSHRHIDA